ncbi:MAG: ATP-binding cassette domain-containing protein [bacterium]
MKNPPLYQLGQIERIINKDKVILAIDSLELSQGALTAIVGPNGAGKSTLLKVLAFLDKPDHGSIQFRGKPVRPQDFSLLRRQVTMVDQTPLLFQGTVFKNVAYGLRVRGAPSKQWPGRVADVLSLVDLGGFANRSVKGLSGGEIQRVAIARALIFQPQVILLDEPTAGVDVARVEMVESLIKELHAAMGVSILFSTHNLAQAYRLTDRVIHLAGGRTIPSSIENLFSGQASQDNNTSLVQLNGGITIRIGSVKTGLVRFTIPAASVEVESFSALEDQTNRFDGIITRMELRGAKVRLLLNGRLNLRAEMPPEDFHRKGLGLGSRVTAIVPPEAIQLL